MKMSGNTQKTGTVAAMILIIGIFTSGKLSFLCFNLTFQLFVTVQLFLLSPSLHRRPKNDFSSSCFASE
ncbi:hypothetical protein L596_010233 [Steinernema carpocapsae]|uniref:7TM GPCR serpentine receptor class x (Srx) domain-containing protein n=1 Tax=Steinernema carpocapsae TaxID=34508 RepID=A0A4U5PJ14_STECR|nr:hypothetical protein L596_010233 [Steinernema carpocapsae]